MESILSKLYYQIVSQNKEHLRTDSAYQEASALWIQAKCAKEPIPLEDGKDLLLEIWGRISFSAGLKLGLSLSQELFSAFPEE